MYCCLVSLLLALNVFAEDKRTLRLTPEQAESLFMKQNLQLIAERMNVDIVDAEIVQSGLLPNPELSAEQINLWRAGREKQFSAELSLLVQTARKRRKLVRRERASREIAVQEFAETLRGLRVELRKSICGMEYLQSCRLTLERQLRLREQLIDAFRRQAMRGNTAKSELLRLQSSALELENEINELEVSLNGMSRTLKSLLNLAPSVELEVTTGDDGFHPVDPDAISLSRLQDIVAERPDVKRTAMEEKYHERSLDYEKSLRIPDITLSANYDRYGGVWNNFAGAGIRFDLPVFNRNQGNIRAARINVEKSRRLSERQLNEARLEIAEAFDNYVRAYRFYMKASDDELPAKLDETLDACTRNFLNRNIGILEYLDFMSAYKSNRMTVLKARENLMARFAELQHATDNAIY
ncbi:MAG: TolC family protein [Prevotellaceae bacterium]|nr:TolC family protein [Prevotellaceae bacterium]